MTTQRYLYDPSDLMQVGDFVDSHSPIDFDVERDDRWQLPEPRKWEPKRISFFTRIKGWIWRMLG